MEVSFGCGLKGNWFGGCKFEPRYDEIPVQVKSDNPLVILASSDSFGSPTIKKIYVCDICVRCGERVNRPQQPQQKTEG